MKGVSNNNLFMIGALLVAAFLIVPGLTSSGAIGGGASQQYPLGAAQTVSYSYYDADKNTPVTTTSIVTYNNPSIGDVYGPNASTQPGGSYTALMAASNYQTILVPFTTGNVVTVPVKGTGKGYDTAVTKSVFNGNGVTVNSISANLTIAAGGSGTAHIKLQQATAYKHLAGPDGKFDLFINTTNTSDWDISQWSVIFDGTQCSPYSGQNPNAISGGVIAAAYTCSGEFAANDGSLHALDIKFQAASGATPGTTREVATVSFAPHQYYANTITNAVAIGSVKNDGTALQALQSTTVSFGA